MFNMFEYKNNNEEFTKKLINSANRASRLYINRIIGLTSMMDSSISGWSSLQKESEIVSDLMHTSCLLLAQNINMSYLFSDDLFALSAEEAPVINAEVFIKSVVAECTELLNGVDNHRNKGLKLQIKCKRSSIKIDEKILTIAIINLLQNAMLYSPQDSTVIVTLDNSIEENSPCGGSIVSISVKNLIGIEYSLTESERSGLGIPLCMKIAEHYGGRFKYVEESGCVIAKLSLPLKEESKIGLSSEFFDYISDRYKPINLFMQEILVSKIKRKKQEEGISK